MPRGKRPQRYLSITDVKQLLEERKRTLDSIRLILAGIMVKTIQEARKKTCDDPSASFRMTNTLTDK